MKCRMLGFGVILSTSAALSGCAIFAETPKPPLPAEIKNKIIDQWSTAAMCLELLPNMNEKQAEQILVPLIEQAGLAYADNYALDEALFEDVFDQAGSKAMARLAQKDSSDFRQTANYCKTQLMADIQKIDLNNQKMRLEQERQRLEAQQKYMAYQQLVNAISGIGQSTSANYQMMMQMNQPRWNVPAPTFGNPPTIITNCRTAGGMTSCSSRERDPNWTPVMPSW